MFKVESRFKALGTDIFLVIICEREEEKIQAQKDLKAVCEIYEKHEKIFSRFDAKSELSFLNNNLGNFQEASAEMVKVSQLALKYNLEMEGLFDPRVIEALENIGYQKDFKENNFQGNGELEKRNLGKLTEDLKIEKNKLFFGRRMDFSGIAKGYITDKVSAFLRSKGKKNFLVDSGGDIFAQGLDEKKEKWKIALENIAEEKMLLEISNAGVATSGITRRKWKVGEKKFHHLINPKNPGNFAFDLQSVTVVAKNTTEADVFAKILFLQGKEKGLEFSRKENIKSLFLDYKGSLYLSEKAKKNLLT